MPLPSATQPLPLTPQRPNRHQQHLQHLQQPHPPSAARSLSHRPVPVPVPESLSVSSVLVPGSSSHDPSNPPSASSASSATTSFQIDWPSDGGPSSATSAHRHPEDIEMDAIAPAGHRRRRSTLSAGLNKSLSPNARAGRPRATSIKSAADAEPKISEEDMVPYSSGPSARDDGDSSAASSLSDEDLHDDEETGLTKKDKRRKRNKRLRNTRLDQRIAKDKLSDEERRQADQNVMRKLVVNAALIGLWYIFSLSISLVRLSWSCFSNLESRTSSLGLVKC